MADQMTEDQRMSLASSADRDGDGVIESHEIPKWKRNPLSMFRDITGSWSSKRVLSFVAISFAAAATMNRAPAAVIIAWLSTAAAMVGVSIGEKK